jgi:lauroyl/myristoyl acyltransferase
VLRFLARDYLLHTADDAEALARFDVSGASGLDAALAAGRGAVLVGSHFGAHVAAFHWFYRRGLVLRLMVQRPRHVAPPLAAFFDRDEDDPQSGYFLRRGLGGTECVQRLLRCRAALRAGRAVYFPGDVPWSGPNTRPGRLLGRDHRLLTVWADLAALTGAPVFHVLCSHRPGGRFKLGLEPAGRVSPGGESAAVAYYLARLESAIAARPCEAVAHLLWPCYGATCPAPAVAHAARPSRRVAAAH